MPLCIKTFLLSFCIFLGLNACQTEPCRDVICGEHGVCTDGICTCKEGYEKDASGACSQEQRQKFIGSFLVNESCNSGSTDNYVCNIQKASSSVHAVLIHNIYNLPNNTFLATVEGNNLVIAEQTSPENFKISGTGNITANILTLQLQIQNNSTNSSDICSLSMQLQ